MPLTDLVVGNVMAWRDLHGAGAEVLLDRLVGNDRHTPVDDGQQHGLADQVFESPVVRMNGDRGIAHHRLRAGGGNRDGPAALDRIVQVVELVVGLFVLHFEV